MEEKIYVAEGAESKQIMLRKADVMKVESYWNVLKFLLEKIYCSSRSSSMLRDAEIYAPETEEFLTNLFLNPDPGNYAAE